MTKIDDEETSQQAAWGEPLKWEPNGNNNDNNNNNNNNNSIIIIITVSSGSRSLGLSD